VATMLATVASLGSRCASRDLALLLRGVDGASERSSERRQGVESRGSVAAPEVEALEAAEPTDTVRVSYELLRDALEVVRDVFESARVASDWSGSAARSHCGLFVDTWT